MDMYLHILREQSFTIIINGVIWSLVQTFLFHVKPNRPNILRAAAMFSAAKLLRFLLDLRQTTLFLFNSLSILSFKMLILYRRIFTLIGPVEMEKLIILFKITVSFFFLFSFYFF